MKFTKMQGCGNDYIYVDCTKTLIENIPETARKVRIDILVSVRWINPD